MKAKTLNDLFSLKYNQSWKLWVRIIQIRDDLATVKGLISRIETVGMRERSEKKN